MIFSFRIDQLFYFISIMALFVAYFLHQEHRLTRIETKLELLYGILNSRSKPQNPPL